jgi:hypothetical protein
MQSFLKSFLFIVLFISSFFVCAQEIIVVNGGVFNSANYANISVQDLSGGTLISMDTIYTTSIQDIVVDGQFAYVAAQDSIVKYDLATYSRVAANAFGAASTVKLAVHGGQLLVGNWYEPWGWTGPYDNHFRVFNTSDLSFVDSIPAISKAASDFVVVGDYAYIAQNNAKLSGWGDTLGYLSVVDLNTLAVVRNDTLSAAGDEIGRLIADGNMIYALNGPSNTISSYNTTTFSKTTQVAAANINPLNNGPTVFADGNGVWYFPFDSGIGSYNLSSNSVVNANIVNFTGDFAFAFDTLNNNFCVSHIDYVDQSNNRGITYDLNGDSTGTFQVGFSPEALAVVKPLLGSAAQIATKKQLNYTLYPNPAESVLNIESEGDEEVNVYVVNQIGNVLVQKTLKAGNFSINTEDFTSGIYFITMINNRGIYRTRSFVKK